jgi:succinate dehydrogenase/fumarate reductase flavoprotein subunit
MRSLSEETIDTDVLVVGGGCAGCWAAIRARDLSADVTLVDKAKVARSGTTLYCHDILAPVPESEFDIWLKEVVEHADYMSDQEFAEILLKELGQRVEDLLDWGVPFERDEGGDLVRSLGRGHLVSRVLLYDGRIMMEKMRQEAIRKGVNIVQRVMVTDLLTSDGQYPTKGRVIGAVGLDTRTGRFVIIRANAVILCTGMIGAKLHFAYADNLTGDGQAMALRAGAEMAGLEFTFNPNYPAIRKDGALTGRSLIQFQTLGAHIVNSHGERFMEKYLPDLKERRSSYGLLGQAMAKEIIEGRGPIYFDMRHFTPREFEQARRIIPITMGILDDAKIDPARELVKCRPVVTCFSASGSGGIRIDTHGQSAVPGLFAGGVAAQFPGGAEVLSGGFIAFCSVFGYRAGQQAAKISQEGPPIKIDPDRVEVMRKGIFSPLERNTGPRPRDVYRRLAKKIIRPENSIILTEETIREMLNEVAAVETEELPYLRADDIHQLVEANELKNFVDNVRAIYISALERKESRLILYRRDYPFKDDLAWLKWVVVKIDNGDLKARFEPVVYQKGRIEPPEPKRTPSPIRFS